MIVVTYRGKNTDPFATRQIPFTNQSNAIKKAESLYKTGHIGIKVSRIQEEVLYIPGREQYNARFIK